MSHDGGQTPTDTGKSIKRTSKTAEGSSSVQRPRRSKQEPFREVEKRWQLFFENAPVYCYMVSPNGQILDVNASALAALGYRKEELVGESLTKLYAPEEHERMTHLLSLWRKNGELRDEEVTIITKDGARRTVLLSANSVDDPDSEPLYSISIQRDITDYKKMRAALQKSERQLQDASARHSALFETIEHGVVYQNGEGKITSANPAAERILGLTFSQMTGRESIDPRWRAIREDGSDFPGDDHPAMVALRTGEPVTNVVMGVFNPLLDDHRWININAMPLLKAGEDKPHQVYTTFDDITERVRHEAQRAQQQGELELYASLLRHDFGNDLQIILGNLEFAEMLMVGASGEVGTRLASVRAAANRMIDLLKALEVKGHFDEGTLSEMLKRTAETAMKIHTGLTVNVNVNEEARSIALTRYRLLGIVFENLLRNASEHAGSKATVNISLSLSGANAVIEISDDGPGVPEDLRPRLFHRGTSRNGGGLGLYLSRQLLGVYNGTIELLASRQGEGARFLITIPSRT